MASSIVIDAKAVNNRHPPYPLNCHNYCKSVILYRISDTAECFFLNSQLFFGIENMSMGYAAGLLDSACLLSGVAV